MGAQGGRAVPKCDSYEIFTGSTRLCALCSVIYRAGNTVHRLFTQLVPKNGQFVDKSVESVDNSPPNRVNWMHFRADI